MLDLVGLGILAGVVPVYLGIAAALVLRRALPGTEEAGVVGLYTGVLEPISKWLYRCEKSL